MYIFISLKGQFLFSILSCNSILFCILFCILVYSILSCKHYFYKGQFLFSILSCNSILFCSLFYSTLYSILFYSLLHLANIILCNMSFYLFHNVHISQKKVKINYVRKYSQKLGVCLIKLTE